MMNAKDLLTLLAFALPAASAWLLVAMAFRWVGVL